MPDTVAAHREAARLDSGTGSLPPVRGSALLAADSLAVLAAAHHMELDDQLGTVAGAAPAASAAGDAR